MKIKHNLLTLHEHHKTLSSTMDRAMKLVPGLVDPKAWVLITADEQTKGQGTAQRRWFSPNQGNLYATYIFMIKKERAIILPQIPQIAALSCIQVIEQDYGLKPVFKWVNDVLLKGQKISGVLCRSNISTLADHYVVQIGIGVNINMSAMDCQKIDQPATSLWIQTGQKQDRQPFLQRLTDQLIQNIKQCITDGFQSFIDLIEARLALIHHAVTIQDAQQIYHGILLGINESGYLRIKHNNDSIITLRRGRILMSPEAFSN